MDRSNEHADIAIIGGGAAGLAAAVTAGEALRGSGAGRIVLCEGSDRVGRSILATGNGRCNFSNARLTEAVLRDAAALEPLYHNAEFAARVFAALEELYQFRGDASARESSRVVSMNAVQGFFASHGLVWREEGEGRLYPLANKASSVLDVLRAAARAAHVEERTGAPVQTIVAAESGAEGFILRLEGGHELRARHVIVATGGSITEDCLARCGVPFVQKRPVLGPIAVDDAGKRVTKRLDNIRAKAAVTLLRGTTPLMREDGEVLFRAYGVSGIAVFDLSREAQPGDALSIDFLPQIAPDKTTSFLSARAERSREAEASAPSYRDVLRGIVLPHVADALCEQANLRASESYDEAGGAQLAHALHDLRFIVEGIGDARQCQVKRGGVAVEALCDETLEVAGSSGLYVAGEAVDVDAACGGFNLHWAWASGMLAGYAASEHVLRTCEEGR